MAETPHTPFPTSGSHDGNADIDDRFVEALLEEHARLGSEDDKALLALIGARTEQQPEAGYESASRKFGPSQWAQLAAAVAIVGISLTAVLRHITSGDGASGGGNSIVASHASSETDDLPASSKPPIRRKKGSAAPHADPRVPRVAPIGDLPLSLSDAGSATASPVMPGIIESSSANRDGAVTRVENPWRLPLDSPLSAFPMRADLDLASYDALQTMIREGREIPADQVQIEAMLNSYRYDYPVPATEDGEPLAIHLAAADCPWNSGHQLVRVAVQAGEPPLAPASERPESNLVFLVDVSGSMSGDDKLPLVRDALKSMLATLGENDRVAILTYAGAESLLLPSTPVSERAAIVTAIDRLRGGGSVDSGGSGIERAYGIASKNFKDGGINRVVICSDGDLDLGLVKRVDLVDLVDQQSAAGLELSICAFGDHGFHNDPLLARVVRNSGKDTRFSSIQSARDAGRVFRHLGGDRNAPVARDASILVEFNPSQVARYRLIGYAAAEEAGTPTAAAEQGQSSSDNGMGMDRLYRGNDFAGGDQLTAFYEVELADANGRDATSDRESGLKYQRPPSETLIDSSELLSARLRYSTGDQPRPKRLEATIEHTSEGRPWAEAQSDFKFASAVALFGMILRDSEHVGAGDLAMVEALLKESGTGKDSERAALLELVAKYRD